MKGVIIIHGLTGTPATVAPLTEKCSKAGFKVVTPLLAGHGKTAECLQKTKQEEWFRDICEAYDSLRSSCEEIYCVGLSLGSLLALKLATEQNKKVTKIACLGTPLKLSPLLEKILLPVSHLPPVRLFLKYSAKDWKESVADKTGLEIYKNASYPKIPIRSVWELQKLQKEIIKKLPALKTPTLLIHSRHDTIAPPANVGLITDLASQISPEIVWLEKSKHVITLDVERDVVSKKVVEFFS